jgi:hypothetical protein
VTAHVCQPSGRSQRLDGSGLEALADAIPLASDDSTARNRARAGGAVERRLHACRCGRVSVAWIGWDSISLSEWVDEL